MIRFQLRPHSERPTVTVAEIYDDTTLIGVLSPGAAHEPLTLRLMSKYLLRGGQLPEQATDFAAVELGEYGRTADNRPLLLLTIRFELAPPGARRPGYN